MQIIIQEHKLEWDVSERDLTFQAVIEEVEAFLLTVGLVPTALTIDGHVLSQEELEEREKKKVKGDEVMEFGVVKVSEFVIENLEGASKANEGLVSDITTFADELYVTTKTVDPKEVIENLRNFFFFWVRMYQLLPHVFEGVKFEGRDFEGAVEQMQEVFKEIVEAMEEEDCVLAADLLQYEVVPLIEMIDRAIPYLKENVVKLSQEFVEDEGKQEVKENKETTGLS